MISITAIHRKLSYVGVTLNAKHEETEMPNERANEIKRRIEALPESLKIKYIPVLKQHFNTMNMMLSKPDEEYSGALQEAFNSLHTKLSEIYDEFKNDGGTTEQWNLLSMAIDFDIYDELFPNDQYTSGNSSHNKLTP